MSDFWKVGDASMSTLLYVNVTHCSWLLIFQCIDHVLLIHSPSEGHLANCQLFASTNMAQVLMLLSLWIHMRGSQQYHNVGGLLGCWGVGILTMLITPTTAWLFCRMATPTFILLAMDKCSHLPMSLSAFVITGFVHCFQSDGYKVVSCFNLTNLSTPHRFLLLWIAYSESLPVDISSFSCLFVGLSRYESLIIYKYLSVSQRFFSSL